jgi:hypothetical protein
MRALAVWAAAVKTAAASCVAVGVSRLGALQADRIKAATQTMIQMVCIFFKLKPPIAGAGTRKTGSPAAWHASFKVAHYIIKPDF